jgi:ubiquinone/menaquinone biosynthesis C-methylase UbiE
VHGAAAASASPVVDEVRTVEKYIPTVDGTPGPECSSDSVRTAYDAVAFEYDKELSGELDGKPLDRALLTAFVELVATGAIADVGCGPGHVSRHLAALHSDVVGVDLSPAMIAIARSHAPQLRFSVGSMLRLDAPDDAWSGLVSLYSIIHLTPHERPTAFAEFARVTQSGGWLLIAFHVDSPEFATGETNHLTEWFGQHLDLNGYFLDPDEVITEVSAAGFTLIARLDRQPAPAGEYPSRRCYLSFQRQDRQRSDQFSSAVGAAATFAPRRQ